jgi:hypothetical protein
MNWHTMRTAKDELLQISSALRACKLYDAGPQGDITISRA